MASAGASVGPAVVFYPQAVLLAGFALGAGAGLQAAAASRAEEEAKAQEWRQEGEEGSAVVDVAPPVQIAQRSSTSATGSSPAEGGREN